MPILRKRRIESLTKEIKTLETDEKRIERDIIGMRNLIQNEGLPNYIQLNLKVYYNLTRSLCKNKERQVLLKNKIQSLTKRKFFIWKKRMTN